MQEAVVKICVSTSGTCHVILICPASVGFKSHPIVTFGYEVASCSAGAATSLGLVQVNEFASMLRGHSDQPGKIEGLCCARSDGLQA